MENKYNDKTKTIVIYNELNKLFINPNELSEDPELLNRFNHQNYNIKNSMKKEIKENKEMQKNNYEVKLLKFTKNLVFPIFKKKNKFKNKNKVSNNSTSKKLFLSELIYNFYIFTKDFNLVMKEYGINNHELSDIINNPVDTRNRTINSQCKYKIVNFLYEYYLNNKKNLPEYSEIIKYYTNLKGIYYKNYSIYGLNLFLINIIGENIEKYIDKSKIDDFLNIYNFKILLSRLIYKSLFNKI